MNINKIECQPMLSNKDNKKDSKDVVTGLRLQPQNKPCCGNKINYLA